MGNLKRLALHLFSIILLLPLISCLPHNPDSEDSKLHAAATNSVIGVPGRPLDVVEVLEKDRYGRVLYIYEGFSQAGPVIVVAVVQKMTEREVYFYDGVNVIFGGKEEIDGVGAVLREKLSDYFTEEQIEHLKKENDWEAGEIKEEKLFKVRSSYEKRNRIPEWKESAAFSRVSPDYHRSYATPLVTDREGKTIYYMRGKKYNSGEGGVLLYSILSFHVRQKGEPNKEHRNHGNS